MGKLVARGVGGKDWFGRGTAVQSLDEVGIPAADEMVERNGDGGAKRVGGVCGLACCRRWRSTLLGNLIHGIADGVRFYSIYMHRSYMV